MIDIYLCKNFFGLGYTLRFLLAVSANFPDNLRTASMLYVASLHNHAIVASGMYHIVSIKTENVVVDEIGRIICLHLLAHAHAYF